MSSSSSNQETILASIITNGDLSKLSPEQKVAYYKNFCERLGLDPLSKPFEIMRLNGKEILYCGRSGVQQLSKLHNVSHTIKSREMVSGCYVVTAQATTPDNRSTEAIGAVPIDGLKGESIANAMMKSETKAKRRATLDLLGLGILDETEVETIPSAQKVPTPQQPSAPVQEEVKPPAHEEAKVEPEISAVEYYGAEVKKCTTKDALDKLYRANTEDIGGDSIVIALFTARKQEIEAAGQPAA